MAGVSNNISILSAGFVNYSWCYYHEREISLAHCGLASCHQFCGTDEGSYQWQGGGRGEQGVVGGDFYTSSVYQ